MKDILILAIMAGVTLISSPYDLSGTEPSNTPEPTHTQDGEHGKWGQAGYSDI